MPATAVHTDGLSVKVGSRVRNPLTRATVESTESGPSINVEQTNVPDIEHPADHEGARRYFQRLDAAPSSVPLTLHGVMFPTAFGTDATDMGAIPYIMVRGDFSHLLPYDVKARTVSGHWVYGGQPDEHDPDAIFNVETCIDMTMLPVTYAGGLFLTEGQPAYGRSCELAMFLANESVDQKGASYRTPKALFTGAVAINQHDEPTGHVIPVIGGDLKRLLTLDGVQLVGNLGDLPPMDYCRALTIREARARMLRSSIVSYTDAQDQACLRWLAGLHDEDIDDAVYDNRAVILAERFEGGTGGQPSLLPRTRWSINPDGSADPVGPTTVVSGGRARARTRPTLRLHIPVYTGEDIPSALAAPLPTARTFSFESLLRSLETSPGLWSGSSVAGVIAPETVPQDSG